MRDAPAGRARRLRRHAGAAAVARRHDSPSASIPPPRRPTRSTARCTASRACLRTASRRSTTRRPTSCAPPSAPCPTPPPTTAWCRRAPRPGARSSHAVEADHLDVVGHFGDRHTSRRTSTGSRPDRAARRSASTRSGPRSSTGCCATAPDRALQCVAAVPLIRRAFTSRRIHRLDQLRRVVARRVDPRATPDDLERLVGIGHEQRSARGPRGPDRASERPRRDRG